jgi:hypothetical protein
MASPLLFGFAGPRGDDGDTVTEVNPGFVAPEVPGFAGANPAHRVGHRRHRGNLSLVKSMTTEFTIGLGDVT